MLLRIVGKYDKRLKQLVKMHGEIWRFKRYSPSAHFCKTGCYYSESLDGTHERWIEEEFIEVIEEVRDAGEISR